MKRYYLILDNLYRIVTILHTDDKNAWEQYDKGGIKVKTFISRNSLAKYLDSKAVNGNSGRLDDMGL